MSPAAGAGAEGGADEHLTGPAITELTLDRESVAAVLDLVEAAADADGVDPLSEAFLLRLRHRSTATIHLVARGRDGGHLGYLGLTRGGDPPDEFVAEAVVHPAYRRQGAGQALVGRALQLATDDPFKIWAHGDLDAAAALAGRLGLQRDRILLRMRRSASLPLPEVKTPAGIRVRDFRPGVDDEEWVEVNARAFAGHPEQAQVGLEDLRDRMAEDWFDPAGFLIAERESDGRLLGFHWTKVHQRPERVGEVYVVGTHPDARGTGLGLALTVAGMEHLVAQGLPEVILYADKTNVVAVRMYERLGFVRDRIDVEYAAPPK